MSMSSTPSATTGTTLAPRTYKVLVIDDEGAVLKLVKAMLTRASYEVTTCPSAMDGLKLLDKEEFDCIVTDAIMPVMTGYDFVKTVRRHPTLAEMPVLMLTRKRHRQDVKKAVEAGVTDYVLKPIDEHLLLDKVEMCLKKGTGKRHIFEYAVNGVQSDAELGIDCKITSMSESDLTMRLPFPLESTVPFHLRSKIFEDIGIPLPLIKLNRCEKISDAGPQDLPYEVKFNFLGVPEPDLRKIRSWLQRQEIQRRK